MEKPAGTPKDPNPTATIAGDGREATKTTGVHDSGGAGGVAEGMYDHSLRKEAYGSKNPGVSKEMHDSNTRDEFRPEERMPKIPDLQDEHHNRNEVYTGVQDEGTRTSGKDNKMPKIPDLQDEHHNTSIRDEATRTAAEEKFEFPTSKNAVDLNDSSVAEPAVKIGSLENPHSPKNRPEKIPTSDYQSKIVDPTGQGTQLLRNCDIYLIILVQHYCDIYLKLILQQWEENLMFLHLLNTLIISMLATNLLQNRGLTLEVTISSHQNLQFLLQKTQNRQKWKTRHDPNPCPRIRLQERYHRPHMR